MLRQYFHWLHGQWPAGHVEQLPHSNEHFESSIPGVYIVGDLTGIPLLKFAADSATRVVHRITQRSSPKTNPSRLDCLIIGAGVSGISAAIEAKKAGLSFKIVESNRPLSTIENFPVGKPIFTYPQEMSPVGGLRIEGSNRERLLDNLQRQVADLDTTPVLATVESIDRVQDGLAARLILDDDSTQIMHAQFIIVAIGRSGQYRGLDVPGADLSHVSNRLHDPSEFSGLPTLVVGGSDSALETAIALARSGSAVTLSYRSCSFTRPKAENIKACTALQTESIRAQAGHIKVILNSNITFIDTNTAQISVHGAPDVSISCTAVFTMLGREPPLDFFRRSKLAIQREWTPKSWAGLLAFFTFCVLVYHWKSYGWFAHHLLNPSEWIGPITHDPESLLYTLKRSASQPSFYYTLVYSLTIGYFGWRRIKRRKTPYVRLQTYCLLMFQWLPLFILPELILPWMGQNHLFVDGASLKPAADLFFESYDNGVGVERAYWRAYGFVLAWPLMVYNWFSHQPMWGWLIVGSFQTFVLIPFIVIRWGKGAYCGWICSCGALAETLGDTQREKMPHGPRWNRLNMLGQFILMLAFMMLGLRVWGWMHPLSWAAVHFDQILQGHSVLSYKWAVDVSLAGFFGVGLYFHFSGRVWCRFACPLAALMHIYARFTKFRIFADKSKCISCNVCTSVCHQGIDVMAFANQGLPMSDPQCVRCSACVSSCPTGVLSFGRFDQNGGVIYDQTPASLLAMTDVLNGAKA